MSVRVLIDDGVIQVRAAVLDGGRPIRLAFTGINSGPAIGSCHNAQVSKRLPGGDCLVVLESGIEAHLSARRGGKDADLTQGMQLSVEVVRACDGDKLAEVKRAALSASTGDWDEIDQLLLRLGPDFGGTIEIGSRALWQSHVHAWASRHPALENAFKQAFGPPGHLFDAAGVNDVLERVLQQRWALPGGGDVRFQTAHAITVFDVNGPDPLSANLAAAKVLPYFCGLAQVGGLMVTDFIDLKRHSDQRKVLEAFDAACAANDLVIQRTNWSKFGMVELRSRRAGPSLPDVWTALPGAPAYHGPHVLQAAAAEAATLPPRPLGLYVSALVYPWLEAQNAAQRLSAHAHVPVTLQADASLPPEAWRLLPA